MPHTAATEHVYQFLYNSSIAAGLYSQLTGVLAGFAFAALVALISGRLAGNPLTAKLTKSYTPLSAAFLGLIATSLNYASIAGEEPGSSRIDSLEISAGAGFVVAGIMLVYSISVLLRAVESEVKYATEKGDPADVGMRAATLIDKVLILGVCPMATLLFAAAVRDHIVSVLVFGFGLILIWKRSYLLHAMDKRTRIGRAASALSDNVLPVAAVAMSILSVIATSLTMSLTQPNDPGSSYVTLIDAILVTTFALATCVATVSHMTDSAMRITTTESGNKIS
jgi:hypothetical protein